VRKRNMFLVLAVVFGMGAWAGLRAPGAQAAQLAPCFYRCICGTPYKCCNTPTGTNCKVDTSGTIGCPQVAC
jgi:hypothetical protein